MPRPIGPGGAMTAIMSPHFGGPAAFPRPATIPADPSGYRQRARMLSSLLDRSFNWTVLPGYSRLGYAVRSRSWAGDRPAGGLRGWSVLVTGANSGIGAAACERLARGGATVHMMVRDLDRGERARDAIAARAGSGELVLELCDVSSMASVREFAERFTAEQPELHALVNNAGVMPAERTRTEEG